ncbi:MAG: FGGY family carbohydrate kinase, partial [Chitinophagaceae bacterium]
MIIDKDYRVIEETVTNIPDTLDPDGDVCEDLNAVVKWMKDNLQMALKNPRYDVKAVNFSAHGASLVHIDETGKPVTPLYDYLKPVSNIISENFYQSFGGKKSFSMETGSPALNMLNSGFQLYWLKNFKPESFSEIKHSLH